MNSESFDFIIVGAGAAGLHLAMAMADDNYFSDKKILILDKDRKETNDRTWCFWEPGTGKWDHIAHRIWETGVFRTEKLNLKLNCHPYKYKMVRGIDFYNYVKSKLQSNNSFVWKFEEVSDINLSDQPVVTTKQGKYTGAHIFDSRIDKSFYNKETKSLNVLQHFKGWVIETGVDVFNEDEFVMMDFRVKWKNETGFIYILPSSKRKALVEFTLFTPRLIEDSEYEEVLKEYINNVLEVTSYAISETEVGVIPMSSFPFHKLNSNVLTKIGTAGGWVKPSSGYSFKNAERYSQKVIENIKAGKKPSSNLIGGRFRKYDTLFLEILQNKNELGPGIFSSMYGKNKAAQIFKFLDEETTVVEDIRIISSFKPGPFQKALFKHWKSFI